jgi:hypothetical protein
MSGDNTEWAAPNAIHTGPADPAFLDVEDPTIHEELQKLGRHGVPNRRFALRLQAHLMQEAGALSGSERTTAMVTEITAIPHNHAKPRRSWLRRLQMTRRA